MPELLQPIWLFSIAAITIPLIIHLWNIREGKTLQVGSILLLQENARQQARSLRLKNIILLLLRCLLIIFLALLLAKPTWKKPLTVIAEKGWILLEKESLYEAGKNYKPVIDSLQKAGFRFHYFNAGFEAGEPDYALKKTAYDVTENPLPYWTLLNQLNEQIPSALPVYLFTGNQLKKFSGARATVSMNLKWLTYTRGDTAAPSIAKAWETSTGSVRVIVANSKPEATFYNIENISDNINTRYTLTNNKGGKLVSLKNSSTARSIEVDTSTLRISIYTDRFYVDANYLKAAIDAIQEYTGLKIKVAITNNADDLKKGGDWLFWLSEKTMPLIKLPRRIFIYEKGKEQRITSWITTRNNFSLNAAPIPLTRLIENNRIVADNSETLWNDGFGHTVLSREKASNYTWHFYSRFNPDWNDLPWSPQFAEMIFNLFIIPDTSSNFDSRIIDTAQLQPEIVTESKSFNKERFIEKTSLDRLFWIIAFVVFCIERYLCLTNSKMAMYG